MSDVLHTLLTAAIPTYPTNSRYSLTPVLETTGADGAVVRFLARRFLPDPDALTEVGVGAVREGDRADLLASTFLHDPELYWRLCDGNRAMHPTDIEIAGATVRITLEEEMSGAVRG
jgi:hypothetical protein